jgi:hypothetical protein
MGFYACKSAPHWPWIMVLLEVLSGGNAKPYLKDYFCQNVSCSLPGWKKPIIANTPWCGQLDLLRNDASLNFDLSCLQVRHSEMTIARSTLLCVVNPLLVQSLCCWFHAKSYFCHFVHVPIFPAIALGSWQGWLISTDWFNLSNWKFTAFSVIDAFF